VVERLKAAQEKFYGEMRALYRSFDEESATPEQKAEFEKKSQELEARDPSAEFVPLFTAIAERAKGTDVAAKAWYQVLMLGGRDQVAPDSPAVRALDRLLTDHLKSPALDPLPSFLQYSTWSLGREKCVDALDKLRSGSPVPAVKAGATFALASVCMDDEATAADRTRAKELLLEVQRDFATQRNEMMETTYGELAGRVLYELDHLQLGMQAPDFESVDQDGVAFKLSDYRGKVIVVDFWGFW
jgi:hypothetical protein